MKRHAKGMSLIELSIVMVVVLLLAIGAIMKFQSFLISVKITAAKNSLLLMRKGINDFYVEQTLKGRPRFPVMNCFHISGDIFSSFTSFLKKFEL